MLKFAEQNNGLMPKDLAQSFSVRAPRASPPFPHRVFEVVCPGLLQEIKDASQTILIREKEAVRTPDGQWMKCYAFADTQVAYKSQALRHLRTAGLDEARLSELRSRLDQSTRDELAKLTPKLAAWMQPLVKRLTQEEKA